VLAGVGENIPWWGCPQSQWGRKANTHRGEGRLCSLMEGRREPILCRSWPAQDPSSRPHFLVPSQAEGSQTPLDAFQLPSSVACKDPSSPASEPTGKSHATSAPEKPQGTTESCAVCVRAVSCMWLAVLTSNLSSVAGHAGSRL
jgi:hypothetical protein